MSHPARESFRQFNNLDPQARLEEFHKRFDRLKSEFQNSQRPMFESANRPLFNDHSWKNSNENTTSANGHVPVEKTIPIQVQHERSRSEPVDSFNVNQTSGSVPSNTVNDRMHFQDSTHFKPENSFFQPKFQHPFAENEATAEIGGEPRVHHIPIQVESRNSTSTPMSKPVPTNQQANSGNVPSQSAPNQANLNYPTQPSFTTSFTSDTISKPGRVIEVPVQIAKSSSTPATSKKNEDVFQKSNSNINKNTASNINESSSDPAIADPNKVYPMGYEPLPNNNQTEKSASENANKKETPFDYVKEILDDLKNYEAQVHEFNGNSSNAKGYRFLDEMLTLCILRLDCINIDGNDELRKYRKSAINEVNRVAAILEAKISKSSNKDDSKEPDETQCIENGEEKVTISDLKSEEPKDKKEAKKLEKAKAKKEKEEKEKAKKESGDKKEGRRIILFRGKNKNKANQSTNSSSTGNEVNDTSAMDVDPNNNDLKDDSTQSTSDQNSEVASTSSGSTLQGKETAV